MYEFVVGFIVAVFHLLAQCLFSSIPQTVTVVHESFHSSQAENIFVSNSIPFRVLQKRKQNLFNYSSDL